MTDPRALPVLLDFLLALRQAGVPASLREHLTLLEGMQRRLVEPGLESFYHWARLCYVKDEQHYDRYDRAFGQFFHGKEGLFSDLQRELPEDWLRHELTRLLSEEDKARLQAMDWQQLMDTLQQRLAEQHERHAGGNKWIGTGGTSPFGAQGYNPAGVRIGQAESRHRKAVKVWDQRLFRNLDDQVELDTRNLKVALRKLRRFARQGAAELLDLPATLRSTARQGGLLDLQWMPERHNTIKVLLLLDIGGSMDDHIRLCEKLFSAARSEFKHLETWYFHNCVYERVWRDNQRRWTEHTPTDQLLHTYDRSYKLIVVGDASMSPYELLYPGGSVEHNNPEPGLTWLGRLYQAYPDHVWLNPVAENHWGYTESNHLIREQLGDRMFPLTLDGLDRAIRRLLRKG